MSSGFGAEPVAALVVAAAALALVAVACLAILSRGTGPRRAGTVDAVTGLANRLGLVQRLERWRGGSGALVIVDIDRFSELNDAFGPAVGDTVLAEVGRRLESVPDIAVAARLGDDEFALVVRNVSGHHALSTLAESIVLDLAEPMLIDASPLSLTVHAAVGAWPMPGATWEDLIQRVSVAVKRAKRAGRSIVVFVPDHVSRQQLSVVAELRRAIENDELRVHYQPRVRLSDEVVIGAEALLRWEHPSRGLLGPAEFIPAAESSGLMHALTRHVLAVAVADAARWQADGLQACVSVNLSAQDLADPGLVTYVAHVLGESGLAPGQLVVEITETALMPEAGVGASVLDALADQGVTVAIDDFGTGYSSLARVATMPAGELKIDRCFITDLATVGSAAVVRATVELAHRLNMRVVAEGVESDEQVARLAELGCDDAQGYWWGRPLPVEKFVVHAIQLNELVGHQEPALAEVVHLHVESRPDAHATQVRDGDGASSRLGVWRRIRGASREALRELSARRVAVVAAGLALYAAWTLFHWGGEQNQELIGDSAFAVVNGFAAAGCWIASRRATGKAATAWRYIAAGVGAFMLGDLVQLVREVFLHSELNPAPDDALYLALSPLALIGLIKFPMAAQRGRRQAMQLVLDVGTIVIAGAAAIWFLVLGPTVAAGGELLQEIISIAYPVGDMVLVFGLTAALLRGVAPAHQRQLQWVAAGMVIMVFTDLVYGWLAVHSTYAGGDAVDLGWALAMAVIGLGALAQSGADDRVSMVDIETVTRRVNLLPYAGVALTYGLMVVAAFQSHIALFPLGGLLIAGGPLAAFVAARQLLSLQENVVLVREYTRLARTDPLTGMANRRRLMDTGDRLYERCRRDGVPLAALMIDIDHFKLVNDTRGHAVGDLLLQHVATLCDAYVRPTDIVGRYGGDEVVVLLPGVSAIEALEIAVRLNDAARTRPLPVDDLRLTMSIGAADSTAAVSLPSLIRNADRALFEAKQAGRDCARMFRPSALSISS
jgi:diguanylate cyclase (GGDEF)-like protein